MSDATALFVSDPEFDKLEKRLQQVTQTMLDRYVVSGSFDNADDLWKAWARHQGALELMGALTEYRKKNGAQKG